MELSVESLQQLFPDLVRDLSSSDIAPIVKTLRQRRVPAGGTLIAQGASSESMCLVVSGRLQVQLEAEGRKLLLGEVEAPGWVGEMSMLKPVTASATVKALEATQIWALPHLAFEALRRNHPRTTSRIIQAITEKLAKRMRSTSLQLIHPLGDGRFQLERLDESTAGSV